jgi:hypothetical protein
VGLVEQRNWVRFAKIIAGQFSALLLWRLSKAHTWLVPFSSMNSTRAGSNAWRNLSPLVRLREMW